MRSVPSQAFVGKMSIQSFQQLRCFLQRNAATICEQQVVLGGPHMHRVRSHPQIGSGFPAIAHQCESGNRPVLLALHSEGRTKLRTKMFAAGVRLDTARKQTVEGGAFAQIRKIFVTRRRGQEVWNK